MDNHGHQQRRDLKKFSLLFVPISIQVHMRTGTESQSLIQQCDQALRAAGGFNGLHWISDPTPKRAQSLRQLYLVPSIVDLLFEKLFNSSSLHPDRQPFVPSGVQV